MKRLISVLLAVIMLLSTMTVGFAGAVKQQNKEASDKKESQSEVTISASPAKKEFAWGDEVVLDVEAKNNTDKDYENVQIRILENKAKFFNVDEDCAATIASLKAGETKTVQIRIQTGTPNALQRVFVVPFYWIVESVKSLFSKKNGGDTTVRVKVGLFNYKFQLDVTDGSEAEKEPEGPTEPAKSVTVSFRLNYEGATEAIPSQTFKAGQKAEYPDFPWREGYTFLGWFADTACENAFSFDTVINKDTVLYAGWMEGSPTHLTLEYLAALLTIEYATGDYPDSVTKDLGLPITFEEYEGVFVMWRSSNNAVIAPDGEVNRPSENTDVTLTATITYNGETKDVSFPLTVIADHSASAAEIEEHSAKDVLAMNGGDAEIEFNEEETQVVMIDGKFYEPVVNDVGDALDAVQSVHAMIGLENPYEELDPYSINADEYGASYAFKQTYQGYEIYGRALTVVTDKNGKADLLNSGAVSTEVLKTVSLTPAITQAEAEAIAKEAGGEGTTVDPEQTHMVIFPLNEYRNSPVLVYVVMITANDGTEMNEFINSQNGEIINETLLKDSINSIEKWCEGSGLSETSGQPIKFPITKKESGILSHENEYYNTFSYEMSDPERNISVYSKANQAFPIFSLQPDVWPDKTAVSAYTNLIKVYDWYKKNLKRKSVDGKGYPIKAYIHCTEETTINNACWSYIPGEKGGYFKFGDNANADVDLKATYASCLDVIGHEFTHGVIRSIVPIDEGYGQNYWGAINEGYADIFGCLIDGNWTIGEQRRIIRDLTDPEKKQKPCHISSEFFKDLRTTNDAWTDSHIDSTLVSHAAYLMYKYGVETKILTIDQLTNLWYKSMSMGLYKDLNIDFNTVYHSVFLAAQHLEFNEEQKSIIVKAFLEEGIPFDGFGRIRGSVEIDSDHDLEELPVWKAVWKISNDNGFSNTAEGTDFSSIMLPGLYMVEMELYSQRTSNDEPEEPLSQCVRYIGMHEVKKNKTTYIDDENDYIPLLAKGTGSLSGKIKNTSTQPFPNATIRLRNGFNFKDSEVLYTATTAYDGAYEIQLDSGYYTMEVQCDGYETVYKNIAVNADEEKVVEVVLSEKKLYGDYLIELTWGDAVSDLDARLMGTGRDGTGFSINYHLKSASDSFGGIIGELDKDDTAGNGKETITFTSEPGGTYTYYVYRFSSDGAMPASDAKVTVYYNDELTGEYLVDTSADPTCRIWDVFKIEDGVFTVLNILV